SYRGSGRTKRLVDLEPQLRVFARGGQAPERARLDLAHPLAGDAEPATDLLQRVRLLAAQAVAELEDEPLAIRQLADQVRDVGIALAGGHVGAEPALALVLDHLPQLGRVLADRRGERHGLLGDALQLLYLRGLDAHLVR